MSRTPSLTPQTALAAAVKVCGPRHAATIDSKNRNAIRRWLIAMGVPNSYVQMFSLEALRAAYGDESDATINALRFDAATVLAARKLVAAMDALDEMSNGQAMVNEDLVSELIDRAKTLLTPKGVVTGTKGH